jgi:hypothetical protein
MNLAGVAALGCAMVERASKILWPTWATWALIAVVLTAIATIAATINDIW